MPDLPHGASAKLSDIKNRYRGTHAQVEGAVKRAPVDTYEWVRNLDEVMGVTGLSAELLKVHSERKLLHLMLTDAGIPEETAQGERICLIGRVAVALGRR